MQKDNFNDSHNNSLEKHTSKQIIKVQYNNIISNNSNSNNCIVSCLDGYCFELSMDLVVKYKISPDSIFSASQWENILSDQRLINCKKIAYDFAFYKMRTKSQVIEKLKSNNFSSEEISISLEFLTRYSLIDDLEFSKKYIHDMLLKKRIGVLSLEQKLLSKGISKENIKKAIAEVYPFDNINDLITKEIEKKMRQISHKPKNKHKQLIINYLISKGFYWDDIKKNIDNYNNF